MSGMLSRSNDHLSSPLEQKMKTFKHVIILVMKKRNKKMEKEKSLKKAKRKNVRKIVRKKLRNKFFHLLMKLKKSFLSKSNK
jgi:hypothetical protein